MMGQTDRRTSERYIDPASRTMRAVFTVTSEHIRFLLFSFSVLHF